MTTESCDETRKRKMILRSVRTSARRAALEDARTEERQGD